MLQARRSQIIEKITLNRMVKVADLMKEYGVSIETIRRDLEFLEKNGFLKRVYGGAVVHGLYCQEPEYEQREVINFEEKRAIAQKVTDMIEDGDTVFIDLGTTCLQVARALCGKKNLTVITNATQIAQEMVNYEGCRVIMLGGEMRQGELSVSGFLADMAIPYFHANKAVLGVGGITRETGITDYHMGESQTRRLVLEQVDKVIAVADFSKFGVTAMNTCCPVSRITTLVTDWSTSDQAVEEYRIAGVQVLVAPAPAER